MGKCAIITGIYGQDGSLLAEYLLTQKYRVVGLVSKRKPDFSGLDFAEIIETDIADPDSMHEVFQNVRPNECYHLAAVHFSSDKKTDMDIRTEMLRVNFLSTQAILDALLEKTPDSRFLYAGSSQMYTPQSDITIVEETTPYRPSSYYGITKVASTQLVDLYRRDRGLWGVTTVLFNHESTRRRADFLSRKVTRAAAEIRKKKNASKSIPYNSIEIRDINARVDWSAAADFVAGFHLSLQGKEATDYVFASGRVHSVRELLEIAFGAVELDWRDFVRTEQPAAGLSLPCLQGNPKKAMQELGWKHKKSFPELIHEMVGHDLVGN